MPVLLPMLLYRDVKKRVLSAPRAPHAIGFVRPWHALQAHAYSVAKYLREGVSRYAQACEDSVIMYILVEKAFKLFLMMAGYAF